MEEVLFTPLAAIVLISAALGALVLLRVLALSREHVVERHDRAREARHARAEYLRRRQAGNGKTAA